VRPRRRVFIFGLFVRLLFLLVMRRVVIYLASALGSGFATIHLLRTGIRAVKIQLALRKGMLGLADLPHVGIVDGSEVNVALASRYLKRFSSNVLLDESL
jgi:hypothetical protein